MLQSSEIFVASGLLFPPSYILLEKRNGLETKQKRNGLETKQKSNGMEIEQKRNGLEIEQKRDGLETKQKRIVMGRVVIFRVSGGSGIPFLKKMWVSSGRGSGISKKISSGFEYLV